MTNLDETATTSASEPEATNSAPKNVRKRAKSHINVAGGWFKIETKDGTLLGPFDIEAVPPGAQRELSLRAAAMHLRDNLATIEATWAALKRGVIHEGGKAVVKDMKPRDRAIVLALQDALFAKTVAENKEHGVKLNTLEKGQHMAEAGRLALGLFDGMTAEQRVAARSTPAVAAHLAKLLGKPESVLDVLIAPASAAAGAPPDVPFDEEGE